MRAGVDVVVAVVETHGRAETQALVTPFEIVARRNVDYQGHRLDEMDIDAVLARAADGSRSSTNSRTATSTAAATPSAGRT